MLLAFSLTPVTLVLLALLGIEARRHRALAGRTH
jgi:hypothetical protein